MGRAAKKVSRNSLESALQKFSQMPAKAEADAIPLNDAFLSLKPAIGDMQKKGYSLTEILDILKDSGIEVGLTTLKSVVSKPRKKRLVPLAKLVKKDDKPAQQNQPELPVSSIQDPDEK